jgi:AbrB family looped-hinge helix DNA binding protein
VSKVTSKLQVTVPKVIAEEFGIRPGDEIQWLSAGDSIRVIASTRSPGRAPDLQERLRRFDEAMERQRRRERKLPRATTQRGRGWTREELYDRGQPR